MHHETSNVKPCAGKNSGAVLRWIDAHPRTGWYVSVIVTLDLLLHIFEVIRCPLLH